MITSETRPASTPARFSAAWMAVLPSSWAGKLANAPLKAPTGVRAALDNDDIVCHRENSCCGRLGPGRLFWRCRILKAPAALSTSGSIKDTRENWPFFDIPQGLPQRGGGPAAAR